MSEGKVFTEHGPNAFEGASTKVGPTESIYRRRQAKLDEIHLDTARACISELERCSNALAKLLPAFASKREELGQIGPALEAHEAIATLEVTEPRITATEIKARVVSHLLEQPEVAELRERKAVLEAEISVQERAARSWERRMSAAQSALNAHHEEARAAGYGGSE